MERIKVSDEVIKKIIALRQSGEKYNEIAKMLGIAESTVSKYLKGVKVEFKCKTCGNLIRGHGKLFCSKECTFEYYKQNPKHEKQCEECGTVYKTNDKTQRYCSVECSSESQVGKDVNVEPSNKHYDSYINNKINSKYSKLEYIGGYTGSDGHIYIMCKDCGNVFKRSAQVIKPSRDGRQIKCSACSNVIRENSQTKIKFLKVLKKRVRRLEAQQEQQAKKEKQKEMQKALDEKYNEIRICKECGCKYKLGDGLNLYCSKECANKWNNRTRAMNRHCRIHKNGNADTSITLSKLLKRDKHICHICGGTVDTEDYYYTEEGYFIAGEQYPSVDHVIPLAKGGLHQWDNVKLAHRCCNNNKSDKLYYEEQNNQIRLSV